MSKYIDELTELICDTVRTVFPNASLDDGYDVADDVIAKLPTIEVEEDCISRSKIVERIEKYKEPCMRPSEMWLIDDMIKVVEDAPSVVPSCQKNRQVERAECEGCKHYVYQLGCTHHATCEYEPKVEE